MTQINPVNEGSSSQYISPYEKARTRAKVDLVLKKLFLTMVVLLNLSAIGAVYTFVTMYCPLKAEPLIATSFIVGVIGGLVSLKIPTFGVNNFNLNQYLSPATLLGRGLAYVFFGPTLLVKGQSDWTDYANASEAHRISDEMKTRNFEHFVEKYGSHIDNLAKYGFIDAERKEDVRILYNEYVPLMMERNYHLFFAKDLIEIPKEFKTEAHKIPNETLMSLLPVEGEKAQAAHIIELKNVLTKLAAKEGEWITLKPQACLYPSPKLEAPNFGKWSVRFLYKFYEKVDQQIETKST